MYKRQDNDIVLNPIEGVRYTVPGTINVANMDEQITVRFRVGGVYTVSYTHLDVYKRQVYNWQKEITRFAPQLKTVIVAGSVPDRASIIRHSKEGEILITCLLYTSRCV